jgi:hypothetical protein
MAPHPGSEEDYIREKARKDLLHLLETVSANSNPNYFYLFSQSRHQDD